MAPLIEELQSLWDGVDAVDVFDENKNHNFVIKVILMWCIHNFPTYDLDLDRWHKDIDDTQNVVPMSQHVNEGLRPPMHLTGGLHGRGYIMVNLFGSTQSKCKIVVWWFVVHGTTLKNLIQMTNF